MKYVLNIQFFASKKGVGSTKNGRDSESKRLYRQRGTHIHPGENVKKGGDDTLFCLIDGVVKYEHLGKKRTKVSVYPAA